MSSTSEIHFLVSDEKWVLEIYAKISALVISVQPVSLADFQRRLSRPIALSGPDEAPVGHGRRELAPDDEA